MTRPLLAALLAATSAMPGVAAVQEGRRASDQNTAYNNRKSGAIRPLHDIESRVVPKMGGARYLGPELYDDRYRLKFMQNGTVIWVDVDARTGEILGRTGD